MISQVLQETAVDLGDTGKDHRYGAGKIQVYDAALRLLGNVEVAGGRLRGALKTMVASFTIGSWVAEFLLLPHPPAFVATTEPQNPLRAAGYSTRTQSRIGAEALDESHRSALPPSRSRFARCTCKSIACPAPHPETRSLRSRSGVPAPLRRGGNSLLRPKSLYCVY